MVASKTNVDDTVVPDQSNEKSINGAPKEGDDDSNMFEKLVNFGTKFRPRDLTPELLGKLSQLLFDYIGMATAGATIPESSVKL